MFKYNSSLSIDCCQDRKHLVAGSGVGAKEAGEGAGGGGGKVSSLAGVEAGGVRSKLSVLYTVGLFSIKLVDLIGNKGLTRLLKHVMETLKSCSHCTNLLQHCKFFF